MVGAFTTESTALITSLFHDLFSSWLGGVGWLTVDLCVMIKHCNDVTHDAMHAHVMLHLWDEVKWYIGVAFFMHSSINCLQN